MDDRQKLLHQLALRTPSRIVLLVLDGVGDIRSEAQPETALEAAHTPNLDALATRSALGRLDPVLPGVTPGSGPGHLGLFGYDPRLPEVDIGRGVLEALGLGVEVPPGALAARGNFASVDQDGLLTDRRAGRIPTEEGVRLCGRLAPVLEARAAEVSGGLRVRIFPGEGYRFVLLIEPGNGEDAGSLCAELADTDPQRLGVAPLPVAAQGAAVEAQATAKRIQSVVDLMQAELSSEPNANSFLLRGFAKQPDIPTLPEMYRLTPGCFAGYPLYRGVSATCGMEVVECGKSFSEIVDRVAERISDFDFLFLHVKQTDQAGEDGDHEKKVAVIEEVDHDLPRLLALGPDVVAVTGDHSTPAPMKAHSWHPIPLLLHGPRCFVDDTTRFDELECLRGHLGTLRSCDLMGMMLANAGKLQKFGA